MPGITKVLSQITTYVVGLLSGTYIRKRKRGRESCFRSDDSCEILDEQKVLFSSHFDFFGSELMFMLNQTVEGLMVHKG